MLLQRPILDPLEVLCSTTQRIELLYLRGARLKWFLSTLEQTQILANHNLALTRLPCRRGKHLRYHRTTHHRLPLPQEAGRILTPLEAATEAPLLLTPMATLQGDHRPLLHLKARHHSLLQIMVHRNCPTETKTGRQRCQIEKVGNTRRCPRFQAQLVAHLPRTCTTRPHLRFLRKCQRAAAALEPDHPNFHLTMRLPACHRRVRRSLPRHNPNKCP